MINLFCASFLGRPTTLDLGAGAALALALPDLLPTKSCCHSLSSSVLLLKGSLASLCFRWAGPGILKLHDDVQTCGYEDVQVMWEMLRTEMEMSHAARRKRSFWKLFLWSDPAAADRQHHRH